jgi:hypothetical protein
MRLQEIFNLAWSDIDRTARRIEIRKSKTDHLTSYQGRTIVLTIGAEGFLGMLRFSLQENGYFKTEKRIFPMSKGAFKQSFVDVLKRAGINDLTFHDLRREAGSRLDAAGLTKGEHDLMMGHRNNDMTSLYIQADLNAIKDKLDRYTLGGLTFNEALKTYGAISLNTKITGKPKPTLLATAFEQSKLKFDSEEEMVAWAEQWKKGRKLAPPYPPQI